MSSPSPQHDHSGQFSLAASVVGFCTAIFGFLRGRKQEAPVKPEDELRRRLMRLEHRLDRLEHAMEKSQAKQEQALADIVAALRFPHPGSGS